MALGGVGVVTRNLNRFHRGPPLQLFPELTFHYVWESITAAIWRRVHEVLLAVAVRLSPVTVRVDKPDSA